MSVSFRGKSDRVKVAVCGELNSGKTSLLNVLYRNGNVPDFFGIPNKPIIKVAFASETDLINYTTFDDQKESVTSLDQIPLDGSVRDVEIFTQDNTFGSCDVIEFTRLRDGYVTDEEIAQVNECDVLVWMTIGSQAWRLSEKTIVGKFTDRKSALSVLAVSRADKFRSSADKTRLENRVVKETSGYFDHHLMMRLEPEALDLANDDDEVWGEIGGKDLVACLSNLIAKITPTPSAAPLILTKTAPNQEEIANPQEEAPKPAFERSFKSSRRMRRISNTLAHRFGEPGTDPTATNEGNAQQHEDVTAKDSTSSACATSIVSAVLESSAEEGHVNDEIKELAEGLDGFLALFTFANTDPDDVALIAGDLSYGEKLAMNLWPSTSLLVKTDAYEQAQWAHLSTTNHQFLYFLKNDGKEVLVLACQSGNAGLTRNAFLRIMKMQDEIALELA